MKSTTETSSILPTDTSPIPLTETTSSIPPTKVTPKVKVCLNFKYFLIQNTLTSPLKPTVQ